MTKKAKNINKKGRIVRHKKALNFGRVLKKRGLLSRVPSVALILIMVLELATSVFLFPVREVVADPGLGDWYNSSWGFRKKITIDHTKVDTDLTNFAVLISLTDTDLKDTANGGHVGQSDAGDILFTNSSGTKLDHELEKYTPSTGELVAWVEADSLSSSSNTDIYIYYGNSTCDNQWDMNATWESSLK